MKILLVDDEKLQLLRLEETVKKVLPEAELLSYSNPLKAFEENEKEQIDIAFLDIEMPGLNGIALAKKLKGVNPKINIIFAGYVSKPVSPAKVKEEVEGLRFPVELEPTKKLQIKCFGNFELFFQAKPLRFSYSKSKELFAYLVDREGSAININELNAVLWEEDHKSYLRNLIADIQKTLKSVGCADVFVKSHNGYSIDVDKVDCDAYEYKKGNPSAIRMYRGEYMIQYSWPIFEDL